MRLTALRPMAFCLVWLSSGFFAQGAAENARAQVDGVTLEALALENRIVFCVTAANNIKISAMYGVIFDTDAAHRSQWGEKLPKTISGEGWEFDLPLRVELKTRNPNTSRAINVQLGACSDRCEIEKFKLSIPPASAGSPVDLPCAR